MDPARIRELEAAATRAYEQARAGDLDAVERYIKATELLLAAMEPRLRPRTGDLDAALPEPLPGPRKPVTGHGRPSIRSEPRSSPDPT